MEIRVISRAGVLPLGLETSLRPRRPRFGTADLADAGRRT